MKPSMLDPNIPDENIEQKLTTSENFRSYSNLEKVVLDSTGFYVIKLKCNSRLPEKYQTILNSREIKYIYIGKAEKQTLRVRLEQEIEHKRPGTFFRSIGCLLNYFPMKGHLKDNSNQYNFKFSTTDTTQIVKWLKSNVEISVVKYAGIFKIEKELIRKYCPLLNYTHNPKKLKELKNYKEKCRKIARGLNPLI